MDDDLRRIRYGAGDDTRALSRLRPDWDAGPSALVARTTAVDTYPTEPGAVYGVRAVTATADDSEGAAVTLTPTGEPFFAANVGTSVPPEDTDVIVFLVDNCHVFRFDG